MKNVGALFAKVSGSVYGWTSKKLKTFLEIDTLENADLSGMNFKHARLEGEVLAGANLRDSSFECANLARADIRNCDCENTSFVKTALYGSNLRDTNVTAPQLMRAYLDKDTILPVGISLADIKNVQRTICRLPIEKDIAEDLRKGWATREVKDSDVSYADFWTRDIVAAENADLSEMNLESVNFRNKTLRGSDLSDANLYQADLRGADLSETKGVTPLQLSWAIIDENTKLPNNISRQNIRDAVENLIISNNPVSINPVRDHIAEFKSSLV